MDLSAQAGSWRLSGSSEAPGYVPEVLSALRTQVMEHSEIRACVAAVHVVTSAAPARGELPTRAVGSARVSE